MRQQLVKFRTAQNGLRGLLTELNPVRPRGMTSLAGVEGLQRVGRFAAAHFTDNEDRWK